ncbi:MAG: ABC transporter permease [Actinobacteria bacterium]|nr:ABC transporter permease [Actinomycetota bacterium]
MGRIRLSFGLITVVVLASLYLPIVFVFINAFNADEELLGWGGFSTSAFSKVLSDARLRHAFLTSFTIAISATVVSLVVAVTAGLWARRAGKIGRAALGFSVYSRLVLPEVVLAVGVFGLLRKMDLPLGQPAIVAGHVVFLSALATVVVQARLRTMNETLEQAAADLGATPLRAFRRVTLPQLMPALLAGGLLVLTFSLDDLLLSQFLAGSNAETVPMLLLGLIRFKITPEANAIGALMMLITVTILVLAVAVVGLRSGVLSAITGSNQTEGDQE